MQFSREISLITSVTSDGYIGVNGDLCIKSPTDLRFFKEITMGKTVIMGRHTYDSLPAPLKGRKSVVITKSTKDYPNKYKSIRDALYGELPHSDVVFIGGQSIFDEAIDYCDIAYITTFDAQCPDGDRIKLTFDDEWLKLYSFKKELLFLIDDQTSTGNITGCVNKWTRNWNLLIGAQS